MKKIQQALINEVLKIVSEVTEVSIKEMTSKTSVRRITDARFMYCAAMLKQNDIEFTLDEIGTPLNYNHSMVHHAAKTVKNYCNTEAEYVLKYETVCQRIWESKVIQELKVQTQLSRIETTAIHVVSTIRLLQDKKELLSSWLRRNADNPDRVKIARDVRELDSQIRTKQELLTSINEKSSS